MHQREMAMLRREGWQRVLGAAVLALLLASAQALAYSAMKQIYSFHDASDTKVFKHQLKEGKKGESFRIRLSLEAGKATCRVVDGDGTVKWEEQFNQGSVTRATRLEGASGDWRVELALDHATGHFSIRLVDF
jgi:hypothetical protein